MINPTSPTAVSPETTDDMALQTAPVTYQAPAIERVITTDDMAREVFYAGTAITDPGGGPGGGP